MLLPNGVEISHPYFARISCEPHVCEVELSDAFPAWLRKVHIAARSAIWDGCHQVESNLGMLEDGRLCWVVHPDDIVASNFVFRELS